MSSRPAPGALRAIIFDLDGVLIDSEPLMRYAFAASYHQVLGAGEPPIEAYLEHMGESFPRIMDKLGLPHTLWQPFRQICRQHIERILLFPSCLDLLEWARGCDLKMAVLTGKDRERTLEILDRFALCDYFSAVVSSDDLCHPKPDPEGMLRALNLLNCRAAEAVMIGDSVSDVLCAQRAGVYAIGVTWGIKPERIQTRCRADDIVHNWQALQQLLLQRYNNAGPRCEETPGL